MLVTLLPSTCNRYLSNCILLPRAGKYRISFLRKYSDELCVTERRAVPLAGAKFRLDSAETLHNEKVINPKQTRPNLRPEAVPNIYQNLASGPNVSFYVKVTPQSKVHQCCKGLAYSNPILLLEGVCGEWQVLHSLAYIV